MKYGVKTYTEALERALKNKSPHESKLVLRRFVSLLYRNREQSKLELVSKDIKKKNMKSLGLREVLIESADPLPPKIKSDIKDIFAGRAVIKETVETNLAAGIKLLIDDELLIDASAKRQLERLFS